MSLAMQRYETWRSQPGLAATLSKQLSAKKRKRISQPCGQKRN